MDGFFVKFASKHAVSGMLDGGYVFRHGNEQRGGGAQETLEVPHSLHDRLCPRDVPVVRQRRILS